MNSFDFGTVAKNITEVRESPLIWLAGIDSNFSLQVDGTGTLASPTMLLYENGVDVSSTKLSGSLSIVTGSRTIVSKTLTSLTGGCFYKWYISFTDGGIATIREGTFIVPKLGVLPSRYPSAIDLYRIKESPIVIYPSESFSRVLEIDGEGTITSASMVIYKGTSDDSANVLSGSVSVSNRSITLKTISSLSGGSFYIVYVYFTDKGTATGRYFEIICPKMGVV